MLGVRRLHALLLHALLLHAPRGLRGLLPLDLHALRGLRILLPLDLQLRLPLLAFPVAKEPPEAGWNSPPLFEEFVPRGGTEALAPWRRAEAALMPRPCSGPSRSLWWSPLSKAEEGVLLMLATQLPVWDSNQPA